MYIYIFYDACIVLCIMYMPIQPIMVANKLICILYLVHIFYQIVSSESQLMEPCRTSQMLGPTSGVTQGSVLGPILFLLYINDINENVQSNVRLFAHDSIIYRKINSNIDHQLLQTDLIQLEKLSDKWQMQFNISKCVHLPITNKTNPAHIIIHYLDTRFLK